MTGVWIPYKQAVNFNLDSSKNTAVYTMRKTEQINMHDALAPVLIN